MLGDFVAGLSYLGNPGYWAAFWLAVAITVPIALIPGISATLVMAITIPFIIISVDDPVIGITMLAVLTGIDNTLDSIPAILLGMPGGATQVTFLEGNQLAQRGKAAHTLGAVYAVSAIGGLVGALSLAIIIPVIAPFVLAFGFAEIAAMAIFGVAMVAALSGGAMIKGIFAGVFGMALSTVGPAPVSIDLRYAFEQTWLGIGTNGLPLIATTIGVFALPEIIDLTMTRKPLAPRNADISYGEIMRGARYGASKWPIAIRQSLFGVFLGAVPGIGSGVVDWMAYAFGIFWTKDKSQFGKGSLDGVLFAESAQNAKEGGQAIPTLAMGVPGGPTWVLVLVGMVAYGISPGPEMLGSNAHITILLVITLALGNLAITALGVLVTGQLAKVTMIPYPVIGATIIPILLLSAFIDTTNWRGIQVVLVMGVVGLAMKHYGWPRPPLLLGFILGPIIEFNFQNGISLFGVVGAATRPLTMVIFGFAAMMAVVLLVSVRRVERETALQEAAAGLTAGPAAVPQAEGPSFPRWRWGHVLPLALIGLGAVFLYDTSGDPVRAALFPRFLSIAVIVLASLQLWWQATREQRKATIMDLGLLSTGVEGSRHAAYKVAGVFALFLLLGATVHLRTAAIAFGVLAPLILLRGPGRWPLAAVTGGLVFLFAFIVLDNVLYVIWPEPFITEWLRENVF